MWNLRLTVFYRNSLFDMWFKLGYLVGRPPSSKPSPQMAISFWCVLWSFLLDRTECLGHQTQHVGIASSKVFWCFPLPRIGLHWKAHSQSIIFCWLPLPTVGFRLFIMTHRSQWVANKWPTSDQSSTTTHSDNLGDCPWVTCKTLSMNEAAQTETSTWPHAGVVLTKMTRLILSLSDAFKMETVPSLCCEKDGLSGFWKVWHGHVLEHKIWSIFWWAFVKRQRQIIFTHKLTQTLNIAFHFLVMNRVPDDSFCSVDLNLMKL